MRDWGKHFGLIDTRRVSQRDEKFWRRLNRGELIRLTKTMVMEQRCFAELKPWEKCEAKAAAVGLGTRSAVVSGMAAARLHGLSVLGHADVVELTLPGTGKPSGRAKWMKGTRVFASLLPGHHVHTEHGIRVTTLLRTAADITRYHGELHGVVCFDSIFRKHPELSKKRAETILRGFRRFHGLARVHQALRLSVTNSDSVPESHARYLLLTQVEEIKTIEVQAQIVDPHTRRVYRVDLLVNGWLVIEIDGRVKYDGETYGPLEQTVLAERDREKALQNQGYMVLRVNPQDLFPLADGTVPFLVLVRQTLCKGSRSRRNG